MATFIPYQIDYSVKNAAKTLGFSKKRVTFKFGFANPSSLEDGSSSVGPQCRGSEHELTFVWSLATGKRHLVLDNKDLHFSESGQNGWTTDRVWQHAFAVRDASTGRTYRVIFISQATTNPRDNTPQEPFDLRIGGVSYFSFNALYQLGTPKMIVHRESTRSASASSSSFSQRNPPPPHHHHQPHHSGRDSPMDAEERRQMASAKLASLQDIAQREQEEVERKAKRYEAATANSSSSSNQAPAMKHEEVSLISFDMDDHPAPQTHPATSIGVAPPNNNNNYYASSMTLDSLLDPSLGTAPQQQPAPTNYYGTNPYAAPIPGMGISTTTTTTGNPYAAANPYSANPYAVPPASTQLYGAAPPPRTATAPDSSQALTPYYGGASPTAAAGNRQPQEPLSYIDSTGRFALGTPPPPPAPYQTTGNDYSSSIGPGSTSGSAYYANNLASPSAVSYGSAPSFAQPPPPPQNAYAQPSYSYSQQQQPPQPPPSGLPPLHTGNAAPAYTNSGPSPYYQQQQPAPHSYPNY